MAKLAHGSKEEAAALAQAEKDEIELRELLKEDFHREQRRKELLANKTLRNLKIKECKERIAMLNLKPYELFSASELAVKRVRKESEKNTEDAKKTN